MRGRPLLYTSYPSEMGLLPTWTQKTVAGLFLVLLLVIPLQIIPGIRFLGDNDWLRILTEVAIFAIGALGLHVLSGLAGQVSLGHAFFMGIGAYTAAVLGGTPRGALWGLELPIWIWLPAAGLVAALVGAIVAPTAVRVRGLYLAIVTLGLVFIGEQWLFRNLADITGGSESGRRFPELVFRFWKEEEPLIDFSRDGRWLWFDLSGEAKTYLILTALLVAFVVVTANLQRTRQGRAFMAIRDRDVAAEVMGVAEAKGKLTAFALSSFYAGVAGALWGSFISALIPETWNLFLSVEFLAILLIGGVGTVAGTLMGTAFVIILPRFVEDFTELLTEIAEGGGFLASIVDPVVSTSQTDFGLVSTFAGNSPGLNVAQANLVLYGLLLIVFLIFEPLGLYGIWLRIRNYWKGWPFTY